MPINHSSSIKPSSRIYKIDNLVLETPLSSLILTQYKIYLPDQL